VAIKVYERSMMSDRNLLQGLQAEVEVMEKLDHPNVITLYETIWDSQKSSLNLVIEMASNGTLRGLLRRSSLKNHYGDPILSEEEPHVITTQLFDALVHVHERGICHGDIKQENCLFDRNGCLKLADFGLASFCEEYTSGLEAMQGTTIYMAPELFAGSYGKGIDVWAAGILTYSLVAGYWPFDAADHDSFSRAIRKGLYTNPIHQDADLSKRGHQFIRLMLTSDVSKRPEASKLRAHAWCSEKLASSTIVMPPQDEDGDGFGDGFGDGDRNGDRFGDGDEDDEEFEDEDEGEGEDENEVEVDVDVKSSELELMASEVIRKATAIGHMNLADRGDKDEALTMKRELRFKGTSAKVLEDRVKMSRIYGTRSMQKKTANEAGTRGLLPANEILVGRVSSEMSSVEMNNLLDELMLELGFTAAAIGATTTISSTSAGLSHGGGKCQLIATRKLLRSRLLRAQQRRRD